MKVFCHPVDQRKRSAIVKYLTGHFRYYTMNPWNRSTSYACNLKVHSLGLAPDITDALYEMMDVSGFYDGIHDLMCSFAEEHKHIWQAGFNGRSGGYLVLYQGTSDGGCYPGRGTDQDEDFARWDMDSLRGRLRLVQHFDRLADSIVQAAIDMTRHCAVVEETVMVPQLVRSIEYV